MSRRQKQHIAGLGEDLQEYAESRTLDFHQYSPYHMRIMDGGYVVLDVWTTGRYFVLMTDYVELAPGTVERGGEKGQLPSSYLHKFIDKIFYPEGIS